MKSLKTHLSVIFPLFVLLFSLQFTITVNRVFQDYSQKLINEYTIVIAAQKEIDEAVLKSRVKGIKSIEQISSKSVLDRLKGNISSKNISLLKIALPKFYSIKLDYFPSFEQIESVKKQLLQNNLITKVETFSKTYTKIYRMLEMLKGFSYVFAAFILIVSLLLMSKQMRIWLLEHKERMAIMTLFGAPFWMKSALLYRLAIIDSILATLFVGTVYMYAPSNDLVQEYLRELDLAVPSYDLILDTAVLMGVSFGFSLLIVSLVIGKMNKE